MISHSVDNAAAIFGAFNFTSRYFVDLLNIDLIYFENMEVESNTWARLFKASLA